LRVDFRASLLSPFSFAGDAGRSKEGAVNTSGRSRSRLQFLVGVGLVLDSSFLPASSPGVWIRPSSSLGCCPWRTASARSDLGGSSANKSGGVPDLEDHL
jgi:hypothetical protein